MLGASGCEQVVHLAQRRLRRVRRLRAHDQNKIFGRGLLDFVGQQTALNQQFFVGRSAHDHTGVLDAGQGCQGALKLHENDGIIVRASANLGQSCWGAGAVFGVKDQLLIHSCTPMHWGGSSGVASFESRRTARGKG